jgi:hypothetical protein
MVDSRNSLRGENVQRNAEVAFKHGQEHVQNQHLLTGERIAMENLKRQDLVTPCTVQSMEDSQSSHRMEHVQNSVDGEYKHEQEHVLTPLLLMGGRHALVN